MITRFSVFRLVICLPLIAGIVFAIYTYRNKSAIARFSNEVENNRAIVLADLMKTFGETRTRQIVEQKAKNSDRLFFDGGSRIVQIVKSRHLHDNHNSDRCCLSVIESGLESNGPYCWSGPDGMRILLNSIRFNDSAVLVDIYGDLRWGSSVLSIPQDKTETYSIPWPTGAKPTVGTFATLIQEKHDIADASE